MCAHSLALKETLMGQWLSMPSPFLLRVNYAIPEKDGNQLLPVVFQNKMWASQERAEGIGWVLRWVLRTNSKFKRKQLPKVCRWDPSQIYSQLEGNSGNVLGNPVCICDVLPDVMRGLGFIVWHSSLCPGWKGKAEWLQHTLIWTQ